ncbi:hypothetical protein Droror1_Dr00012795 [Drosera rotundifolia]
METQQLLIRTGISVACIVVFTWVWKLFNLVWITPKSLEKKLREQGLSGTPYRLLHGDIEESAMMSHEALSKPMVLFSNDHISRIMPYEKHIIKKHGNCSFMWQGPVATVFICEPELMREVLNKIDAFHKPKANPLSGFLTPGFIQYEGEKWSKHRKLVTPALYSEKLKVTMILNEVLRLYPPAPSLRRSVVHDVTLGNLTIPAGVQVSLPFMVVHLDTKIWGEDALEFNPERFSDGISNAMQGNNCFFPFSGGPRICIGQNFAMNEAKLAVTMILQRFSFKLSPSYAHGPVLAPLLEPQYGIPIILRRL